MAHGEDKNPTKKIYDTMYYAGQGRWVMSIVVLGLAAAIMAEKPTDPWTLAGGAISIACVSIFSKRNPAYRKTSQRPY
jgi:hypothetical protein